MKKMLTITGLLSICFTLNANAAGYSCVSQTLNAWDRVYVPGLGAATIREISEDEKIAVIALDFAEERDITVKTTFLSKAVESDKECPTGGEICIDDRVSIIRSGEIGRVSEVFCNNMAIVLTDGGYKSYVNYKRFSELSKLK